MSYSDIAVGRRNKKKGILLRWITVKCISALILFLALYYALLVIKNYLDPIFTIRSIEIEGLDRLKKEEIIDLSGLGSKTNLLLVNLDEIYRRIKGSPWVKDIFIRKELPMTIIIEVMERRPEARIITKNGIYLIDNEGLALEKADWIDDSLPLIKGLENAEISSGKRVEWEGAREDIEIIKHLLSHINNNAHNNLVVDISKREEIKIYLQDYILRLGTRESQEKLDRFLDVEEDLKKRFNGPIEIDLRFPRRIIVRQLERGEKEIG